MIREFMGVAVCLLSVGAVFAEPVTGVLVKIEGDKITFHKKNINDNAAMRGDAQVLTVGADCKIMTGQFNKETNKFEGKNVLEGGLKNKNFVFFYLYTKGKAALPARGGVPPADDGIPCTVDSDGKAAKSIVFGRN